MVLFRSYKVLSRAGSYGVRVQYNVSRVAKR